MARTALRADIRLPRTARLLLRAHLVLGTNKLPAFSRRCLKSHRRLDFRRRGSWHGCFVRAANFAPVASVARRAALIGRFWLRRELPCAAPWIRRALRRGPRE